MSVIDIETEPIEGACFLFAPHDVRKNCKICLKPKQDHPFSEEDASEVKALLSLFEDQPEILQNDEYAWIPTGCPRNRVDDFFQEFPDDQVPRHQSEGQNNRLKRLAFQIPPSDVSVVNNRFTEPEFKPEMEDYITKLQTTVLKLGSVKEWSKDMPSLCPKCLLVLQPGELVITNGERCGQGFHLTCFVCRECQELPADLVHCFDFKGEVFCVRHYGNDNKKRCYTCDELIFSPEFKVGERFFHSNHLLCFACEEPVEGSQGSMNNGELHCRTCYERNFGHECAKCKKEIHLDQSFIQHEECYYHHDCFNCHRCNASLHGKSSNVVDGEILCWDCSGPRCDKCGTICEAQSTVRNYEGKVYHVDCFRCTDCKKIVGKDNFVPNQVDGLVYCQECYQRNFAVTCFRCNQKITDDLGLMYEDQLYHEDCFKCYNCSKNLKGEHFKEADDKWYCFPCYEEKFCQDCHSCGEQIHLEDTLYTFQDYQWHERCFICSECKRSLVDFVDFVIKDKLMICSICLSDKQKVASKEKIKRDAEKEEWKREAEKEQRRKDAEEEERRKEEEERRKEEEERRKEEEERRKEEEERRKEEEERRKDAEEEERRRMKEKVKQLQRRRSSRRK